MKPRQFVKLLRLAIDERASARDRDWAISQVKGHREEFQFQDLAAAINEADTDKSPGLRAKMKKLLNELWGHLPKRPARAKRIAAISQRLDRGAFTGPKIASCTRR